MLKILQSKPYDLSPGRNVYGEDYQVPVSTKTARLIAGLYPLPRPGHRITVAIKRGLNGNNLLTLQNMGGDYYIASVDYPVTFWPVAFRVQVYFKGRAIGEAVAQ